MIKGVGIDVVEIARIAEMIRKYGDHFLVKVFTENEIGYCSALAAPALHYAGRWASKEAFYKAVPPSCQKISGFKSIEILSGDLRMPTINVREEKLAAALSAQDITSIHVSISHEKFICVAMVIVS